MQNLSWIVNFFKLLVCILHHFCVEIVRWGSFFQLIVLGEYFKLIKCPARFIIIRSILKRMITSVLSNVWREPSNHGIRNPRILRRLWYIFYTILQNIFLLVWYISNWMLSLEYWTAGHVWSMKQHFKVFETKWSSYFWLNLSRTWSNCRPKGVSEFLVLCRIWYYFYCWSRSEMTGKNWRAKKCMQKNSNNSTTKMIDQTPVDGIPSTCVTKA